MKHLGFSLIEVVISIGIIAVIGVFSSTLLTRTYNSTAQIDAISRLKQNGQQALGILTEAIRTADGVICYGTYGTLDNRNNYIVIRDNLGKFTRFWFVEPVPPSGVPTENGYLARQGNLSPSAIKAFCDPLTNISLNSRVALSDNSTITGVSISGGRFNRVLGNEGKDTVDILFYISPSLKPYNSITDPAMQTTVKVR